jgi:hypothetical protein
MTDDQNNVNMNDSHRKKALWITAILVAVVLITILSIAFHTANSSPDLFSIKTLLVFLFTALVLAAATYGIILKKNKVEIQYVIAFDITVFVVIGFALIVSAAVHWQAACLTAGSSLLGGGFFGLIFGMPLSAASAPSTTDVQNKAAQAAAAAQTALADANTDQAQAAQLIQQAQTSAQKAAVMTGRVAKHSLLAEAAGTLSKLIAGATLVQVKPIFDAFKATSAYISVYLLQDSPPNGATFGGAVLLYFTFLGFLSGLFLPAYFMQDFWDKQ